MYLYLKSVKADATQVPGFVDMNLSSEAEFDLEDGAAAAHINSLLTEFRATDDAGKSMRQLLEVLLKDVEEDRTDLGNTVRQMLELVNQVGTAAGAKASLLLLDLVEQARMGSVASASTSKTNSKAPDLGGKRTFATKAKIKIDKAADAKALRKTLGRNQPVVLVQAAQAAPVVVPAAKAADHLPGHKRALSRRGASRGVQKRASRPVRFLRFVEGAPLRSVRVLSRVEGSDVFKPVQVLRGVRWGTFWPAPTVSPFVRGSTKVDGQPSVYYVSQAVAAKPTSVLEAQLKTLTPVLPRALYRRWRRDRQSFSRLRPRKNRPFMVAYRLLMARRTRSLIYKKRYARRFLKLSLLKAACQHLATFPVNLTVRRYVCRTRYFKHLRHRAVFSRWSRQWYFLPTVVLVLAALMRGSTALLMAWLLRLLKSAKKHSAILYLVSTAFKYFLYQPNTAHLVTNLPCSGVRLEVIGKIDGQDRAQTFKVQVGAIPTSTLSAPLEVEYAACGTIYGVLGVWLWLFMKPQPLKSQTLLVRPQTAVRSRPSQK
jgi:hypothetical protein